MRKRQTITLVASLVLSLAVTPSVEAKGKPKPKPSAAAPSALPSAPTILDVSYAWNTKGTVDVLVKIEIPLEWPNTGRGGQIDVFAGDRKCRLHNKTLKPSCSFFGIRVGQTLNIQARSANAMGWGATSESFAFEGPSVRQGEVVKSAIRNIRYLGPNGLLAQLQKNGFSLEEATYGVEKAPIKWRRQAEKVAQNHLKKKEFSRSDLISQLHNEGFSIDDATFAVTRNGF
jgi:hypothetical protein